MVLREFRVGVGFRGLLSRVGSFCLLVSVSLFFKDLFDDQRQMKAVYETCL